MPFSLSVSLSSPTPYTSLTLKVPMSYIYIYIYIYVCDISSLRVKTAFKYEPRYRTEWRDQWLRSGDFFFPRISRIFLKTNHPSVRRVIRCLWQWINRPELEVDY